MTSSSHRQVLVGSILLLIVCITQRSLCSGNDVSRNIIYEDFEITPYEIRYKSVNRTQARHDSKISTTSAPKVSTTTERIDAPPTPVFSRNYHVNGVLSLPYAELNEPFEAWFDWDKGKSRTEYYGDLYKIYQFNPRASKTKFGVLYKLAYVPANFYSNINQQEHSAEGNQEELENIMQDLRDIENSYHNPNITSKKYTKKNDNQQSTGKPTLTRRACFVAEGFVGFTMRPQTVLPDLTNFDYEGEVRCPQVSDIEHRHSQCELWKYTKQVDDKKNVYKFWLRRQNGTGEVIPVHYYMLGFDSLLGSHYDRYDISYSNYNPNGALDSDFEFDPQSEQCGPMPGPGVGADSTDLRSHLVLSNPIHEYVIEPHRYDHIDREYVSFKKDNGLNRHYDTNGREDRKKWHKFLHNSRFVKAKNRELKEFKLKLNRFAENELGTQRLRGRLHSKGYNGGLDYATQHRYFSKDGKVDFANVPESLDWARLGAVTPVKDQAVCGSCWSFGTSGAVEGAYFVKRKKERGDGRLLKLSQQQMIDCSWRFGNNGCDGGEDFRAYKYIMQAGGLATEDDYGHYLGVDGKCHDDESVKSVQIKGFYNVTMNDVDALKHALYNYGPVTVAIDASQPTFTFYSHGVYYDPKCQKSPDNLDHQVLVVGYTEIDGQLVWIVKNSWSTYWGDDGYIMMAAKDNNCGLLDAPTVPIISHIDEQDLS